LNILPGTSIVGMIKKRSIRLYCLCNTLESLHTLRQQIDSVELKPKVENIFNNLLLKQTSTDLVHLKMLYLVDYCKCEDFFIPGKISVLIMICNIYLCPFKLCEGRSGALFPLSCARHAALDLVPWRA